MHVAELVSADRDGAPPAVPAAAWVGRCLGAYRLVAHYEALPATQRTEVLRQYNEGVTHHHLGDALEARAARQRDANARRADRAAACVHYRRGQELLLINEKRQPADALTNSARDEAAKAVRRCDARR